MSDVNEEASMIVDEMKALVRRSLQMWAGGNTDDPAEVFAANYVNHQEPAAVGGVKAVGLGDWKDIVAGCHRAFPDLEVTILMQIAEGDLVATRWQFAGTQDGEYLGHAPSGKRAIWSGVQIDRVAKGKIVESWVDWDKYRMFEALGFLG
jgi:predicted ester cyclase